MINNDVVGNSPLNCVRARRTTDLTLGNAATNTISFNIEDKDFYSTFDGTTFIAPATGNYAIAWDIRVNATGTISAAEVTIGVKVNNTDYSLQLVHVNASTNNIYVSANRRSMQLTVGDTVQCRAYVNFLGATAIKMVGAHNSALSIEQW